MKEDTILDVVGAALDVAPEDIELVYDNLASVIAKAHDAAMDDDDKYPTQWHVIAEMVEAAHEEYPMVQTDLFAALSLVFMACGTNDEKERFLSRLAKAFAEAF